MPAVTNKEVWLVQVKLSDRMPVGVSILGDGGPET